MPFTKYAVDSFISARATAITRCGASDMNLAEPGWRNWLTNVGLSAIFTDFPPEVMRPFAINFIRRITTAFLEYDLARTAVLALIVDGNGRWSPYFMALSHFECVIAQLYTALDSVRKYANHDFFKMGDGSFEEHLNRLYNSGRHELPKRELPVWFSNDGLHHSEAMVTFGEIEDFMSKMAGVVKGLCDCEAAQRVMTAEQPRS